MKGTKKKTFFNYEKREKARKKKVVVLSKTLLPEEIVPGRASRFSVEKEPVTAGQIMVGRILPVGH